MTPERPAESAERTTPFRAGIVVYVGAVALVGVGLTAWSVRIWGLELDQSLIVLLLLAGLNWWSGPVVVDDRVRLTFSSIVLLAAMALLGPAGAGLVGMVMGSIQRGAVPMRARVFNTGMSANLGVVGGLAYLASGGVSDSSGLVGAPEILRGVGYPILVADLVQVAVNLVLLAGVLRLSDGVSTRAQIGRLLRTTGPAYIGYGIVAFLMVVLWQPADLGPWSAVLVLAPLLVARWAYTQYAEEAKAHDQALHVLVAAIEAKAPHLTGHSARVAELSALVAEDLGLRSHVVQETRVAGMLHDLGQTSLPTALVRGSDSGPAGYPARGADLLKDLTFLSGSLDAVAGHRDALAATKGRPSLPAAIVGLVDEYDLLTQVGTPEGVRLDPQPALVRLRALPGVGDDLVRALDTALARLHASPAGGTRT